MHAFTLLFLTLLALSTAIHLWLAQRQSAHVTRHREHVPAPFEGRIPLAAHRRAADYTLAKNRLGRLELIAGTCLLLAWTAGGGLTLLDGGARTLAWSPVWTGIAVILAMTLINGVLTLPIDSYRTFKLEAGFGFNRTCLNTYITDKLKGIGLTLALGIPVLWTVLTLMETSGGYWWLWVWLVWTGFTVLMMWAFPKFIAPLFNRFQPLPDNTLRQRIAGLLQRCGFTNQGVFVMDGSKRSGHGNAYFTGFGRNKRIVFFDTLLASLNERQIEAVLAHELGHFHHRHIRTHAIVISSVTLIALALLGWLIETPWFYAGLGVDRPSTYLALALLIIAGPVFGFWITPLNAMLARRHEFAADAYAARQTNAADLMSALVKLYQDNAATLTPDPLHSAYYDSHPPAPVRIARLQAQHRNTNRHLSSHHNRRETPCAPSSPPASSHSSSVTPHRPSDRKQ